MEQNGFTRAGSNGRLTLAVPSKGRMAEPEDVAEGGVALLAQLLGLLVAFIGESLTLRLVHDIWPAVPLSDLDFGERGEEQ